MLMDLIDHGPVERSRIAIASGLAWPMVIAMAIDSFGDGDRTLASVILILVAQVFYCIAKRPRWFTFYKEITSILWSWGNRYRDCNSNFSRP